ncbi:5-dehydro-2-deoxygluconokinase [bacterium]|nr:5-dehydro-2-deoxygluconokinase [Gemmatimonadota bacterium]MCH2665481.1 5-dehydro-2-deoxygluconokinase [bacterium]HCK09831.1 5-dehydro-2-deoxygluconokinase [Candidatus Latescibacterota bacterium]
MGRSCIDLYSNDIGAAFFDIKSFSAYVGGSPTNISVGARRLGRQTALLTAIGDDPVGEFVMKFLDEEGVDTRCIATKPGRRTSAAALAIEPPDRFPLIYYRENCADAALTIDDVDASPIRDADVFQFAGTNLSIEPCRTATLYAAEVAHKAAKTVVLDLDLRADQWADLRSFGVAIRSSLHNVDIVLGTADEVRAAGLKDPGRLSVSHSQVSDARVEGDIERAVQGLMGLGPTAVVEKTGPEGARVYERRGVSSDVRTAEGFPVDILNVLGAGDAFGAGFIYGLAEGWDLQRCARFGNACGAIVVTRHGCSVSMPTLEEVEAFVEERGGL